MAPVNPHAIPIRSTATLKPLAAAITTCLALSASSAFATTYTVNSHTDDGSGGLTLREAIAFANGNPGPDTINFDNGMNNLTILLAGSQINITDTAALTIDASALANGITISGNNASRIFGVTENQPLTLNNLTITQGRTTANTTTFTADCTLATFTRGGAICAEGDLTLIDSTISGNSTAGDSARGGGFFAYGDATLSSSTVSGNSTLGGSSGGGFFARGAATLTNSTVSGNSTLGNFASGGGFYALGTATLTNSTVSGNNTAGESVRGGGFYALGTATLTNSTVSGNSTAGYYAYGGGFYARGSITLTNSTISQNRAQHASATGDGVFVWSNAATLTLNSTILSGNGTDNFASGNSPTVNATRSLFGDAEAEITSSGGTNSNNVFSNMPELIGLADNGCAAVAPMACVYTHKPATESPAVDAGATNGQTTDQRGAGFNRILGAQADIGAFERPAVIPPNPLGECDGNPGINIQDVICTINKVLNP